jgi:hypothetical protein
MFSELHGQTKVAQRLLQDAQICVLLNRLGGVKAEGALGNDHTLSNHARCLLDVAVALSPDGINVLNQQLLELFLVLLRKLGSVLDGRLGKLVRLDLTRQSRSQLVID